MSSSTLLLNAITVPLIASLLSFICCRSENTGYRFSTTVHALGTVLVFLITMTLAISVASSGSSLADGSVMAANQWFYLDGLSALVLGVLGLVALITGIYSIGYIGHEYREGELTERQVATYYGLFNLFLATMILAVVSNNVIMMWVGIEATTISSVFLVGFYGKRSSLEAAWKYIMICSVGVAFGLFGSILTYSNAAAVISDPAHAILWTEIRNQAVLLDPVLVQLAFVFALVGFGTKTGLFPMHAWLPDAHSEAPSPVSALLSAGLLNCALLVILRYYIITVKVLGTGFPQYLLLGFGVMSVAVAAFFILTQKDIKRKLAYSSVENMGLVTLAIGLGPLGAVAGLFHMINHSIVKALLFCASGNVLLKYGSRDMGVVKGLIKVAPKTGLILAGGLLALSGVPPFSIFLSEFSIVTAGISSGHTVLFILLMLLLTVVLAGFVKVISDCVFGEAPANVKRGGLGFMTVAPIAAALVLALVMGVRVPDFVTRGIDSAALVVLDSDQESVMDELSLSFPEAFSGAMEKPLAGTEKAEVIMAGQARN